MELQKLDNKRSYGMVYGHDSAMYEQDGKLFGGDGKALVLEEPQEEQDDSVSKTTTLTLPKKLASAEEFLRALLHETVMAKSNVYKEVQMQKQDWSKVQEAATKLGVNSYQLKGVEM